MRTPINPQESYLLERYSSLDYFAQLRDTWAEMVRHLETCLDAFMASLPANYRSRPLPEQPDAVWGERVLPNFRSVLQGLNTGVTLLSHGDVNGLNYAHGPNNAFRGQIEFWSGWLSGPDEERYRALLRQATTLASNICATEGAYWRPRDLSRYPKERGPLDPPAKWPTYRLNKDVAVVAGEKTATSGIYLPDVEDSCAQFLSTSYKQAPLANVLVRMADLLDEVGAKYGERPVFEERQCVWYLAERAADVDASTSPESVENPRHQRIPAGE